MRVLGWSRKVATRQLKEEVAVDEGIEVGEFVMTFFDLFFLLFHDLETCRRCNLISTQ